LIRKYRHLAASHAGRGNEREKRGIETGMFGRLQPQTSGIRGELSIKSFRK
jgi:hypothetical protein